MAKKKGISLKGMKFQYGNIHYEIGDMYGVPFKRSSQCILYKNGENIGLIDMDLLIRKFNINT